MLLPPTRAERERLNQKQVRRQTGLAHERRAHLRGLLLLALAILLFTLLRHDPHRIFTPGWWRLW